MADFSIPLQGMSNALAQFNTAAARIAGAPLSAQARTDNLDLSNEMVALLTSRNSYEANISVAHTVDEMQGSLLNVLG